MTPGEIALRDELRRVRAAIRRVHSRSEIGDWCSTCHDRWPCDTRRLLTPVRVVVGAPRTPQQ